MKFIDNCLSLIIGLKKMNTFTDSALDLRDRLPSPSFQSHNYPGNQPHYVIPCLRKLDMTYDRELHMTISQVLINKVESLGVCHEKRKVNLNIPTLFFLHWRLQNAGNTKFSSVTQELRQYLYLISKLC